MMLGLGLSLHAMPVVGASGFNPEALGSLLLWQRGSDLGTVSATVANWTNQAAAGPAQLDSSGSAGSAVVVNDFFTLKMARCENAAFSYMESNASLGWDGADFYMAAVVAVDSVESNGDAQLLHMNSGTFTVIINNSGEVGVRIADNPYSFADVVYPGSNTLFLVEAWRASGTIRCAINGVDTTNPQAEATTEAAGLALLVGNVGGGAGCYVGELLFYDELISDRAALRAYLETAWGL
jgi:hypothetical protein